MYKHNEKLSKQNQMKEEYNQYLLMKKQQEDIRREKRLTKFDIIDTESFKIGTGNRKVLKYNPHPEENSNSIPQQNAYNQPIVNYSRLANKNASNFNIISHNDNTNYGTESKKQQNQNIDQLQNNNNNMNYHSKNQQSQPRNKSANFTQNQPSIQNYESETNNKYQKQEDHKEERQELEKPDDYIMSESEYIRMMKDYVAGQHKMDPTIDPNYVYSKEEYDSYVSYMKSQMQSQMQPKKYEPEPEQQAEQNYYANPYDNYSSQYGTEKQENVESQYKGNQNQNNQNQRQYHSNNNSSNINQAQSKNNNYDTNSMSSRNTPYNNNVINQNDKALAYQNNPKNVNKTNLIILV
jgi:hypothetical protein